MPTQNEIETAIARTERGNPSERFLMHDHSVPALSRLGSYSTKAGVSLCGARFSRVSSGLKMVLGFIAAYGALSFIDGKKAGAEPLFETLLYQADANGEIGLFNFRVTNVPNNPGPNDPAYTEIVIDNAELRYLQILWMKRDQAAVFLTPSTN